MELKRRVLAAVALTTATMLAAALPAPANAEPPGGAVPAEELIGVLRMPGGEDGFRKLAGEPTPDALKPRRTLQEVAELQRKATQAAASNPGSANKRTTLTPDNYDYFTWDQCRENDPPQDEQRVNVRNHFALCVVARGRYDFYRRILGVPIWVGGYTFRTTILGKGQRGQQRMEYELQLDDWDDSGFVNPGAELDVDLNCQNYPRAACRTTNFDGRNDTIAGWQRNGYYRVLFDTSDSQGGGDTIHYDADKVNYHDFQLAMESAEGTWVFDHPFRCDAATYASGGACIYHNIDAVMHYSLTREGVDEVAAHIKKAQDDPENVKPGGLGTKIAGGKASGKMLTRLVETMDPKAKRFADRSSDIIERDCRRHWTEDERRGKDCDEFPFKSTWEGAAYTEEYPGAIWKFSVRPVDRTQNRRAGNILRDWYRNDHILAQDAFWVQINP